MLSKYCQRGLQIPFRTLGLYGSFDSSQNVGRYPVPVYVYKYEGNCRCKSAVAKIIMLSNNKKNFIVFKETFVLVIHRKFVKQRFTSKKRCSVSQTMISD